MLQYNYRTFHVHTQLNALDMEIIELLFDLSINSAYQIVRDEARQNLYFLLSQYPYSAQALVSKLTQLLKRTNDEKNKFTTEQLEGCLLLLNGNSQQNSFLIKQSWSVIGKVWPLLFKCKHLEKESTHALVDSLYVNTNENFVSFDNTTRLGADAIIHAFILNPALADTYADEAVRLQSFNMSLNEDKKVISKLMSRLVAITNDPKIVWKNQKISAFSLIYLLNACQIHADLLNVECVKLFVDMLVHESVSFREVINIFFF